MENFTTSTIIKYLRKVLREIDNIYIDSGLKNAYILKKYLEYYEMTDEDTPKLVLLSMLKDIGTFYNDGEVPKDNHAYAAASSYTFLKYCSPLGDVARPLMFYKARYVEGMVSEDDPAYKDYYLGLLMTLINQIVLYDYMEYTLEEITDLIKVDTKSQFHPEQVRKLLRMLKKEPEILEKLNSRSSLYVYETSSYISKANYTDEDLMGFIETTNYIFEFHNHETLAHTITTAEIAKYIAQKFRLSEARVEEIYIAGLVHDIGKIRIPVNVLTSPNKLECEEYELMKHHVEYTKEILQGSFSDEVIAIASRHHERLDGSGYPLGLVARDLSIGDKIIMVADVASALYSKRSYKNSYDDDEIIGVLEREVKDGLLDDRVVNKFVDYYDEIMNIAKAREKDVLSKYQKMKEQYNKLISNDQLIEFFNEEDDSIDIIDTDLP